MTDADGWMPNPGFNPAPGVRVDVRLGNNPMCSGEDTNFWDWSADAYYNITHWRPHVSAAAAGSSEGKGPLQAKATTPASQPDFSDLRALAYALRPFAALADKFSGTMVEVSDPHPDNPSRNIQPLQTVCLLRAAALLDALEGRK